MTASTALLPSVRVAFGALIDYAGLFPPAQLPIAQAKSEYQAARRGPYAWMLGRFIIPAPLLIGLPAPLEGPLSVIVDNAPDTLVEIATMRNKGAQIEALELPLRIAPDRTRISRDEILDVTGDLETDIVVAGVRDLSAFVEIPRSGPWHGMLPETMSALARMRLYGKLRCGGVTAQAFPSVDDVAAFIAAAHAAGVAFKATAGLHHPVRHVDRSTGFTMHGFLNILAAAALAPRLDTSALARVVAEEDSAAFTFDDESFSWRDQRIELSELARTRRDAFVSYGSCSFAEPVADLTALGVLPPQ